MSVFVKWFPPSWIQIKTDEKTLYIDTAVKAALSVHSKIVIPMHHLKANPQNFKKKIETNSDIHCAVLKIGESYCLS